MCRSREHALMVHLEHHPDSRSLAVWSTSFDAEGQGSLFGDVFSFADDADGHQRLHDHLAADFAAWIVGALTMMAGMTHQ